MAPLHQIVDINLTNKNNSGQGFYLLLYHKAVSFALWGCCSRTASEHFAKTSKIGNIARGCKCCS